jgi:arginyl-tRNA synthetase
MDDVRSVLEQRLARAFDAVHPGADPVLRPSDRSDLQANGALALARVLNRPPRDIAQMVVEQLDVADLCEEVEVSGNGFINLTFSSDFLADRLGWLAADPRLGIERAPSPETIVVDYSAPNVAKEMHVGHLRTTVIGDALARMLGFLGHDVRRENHIGDWGTPFGMLIEHLVDLGEEVGAHELSTGDLTGFYQQARASFDADAAFADRSRHRVVLLQSGDEETLRLWRVLVGESIRYFDAVYTKLGVQLTDDDIVGESFYNDMLPEVVEELDQKGLLVVDDGAKCVFPPGFANREGDPLPLIVQKSDGGYGYATSDLAAIRHRVLDLGATRMLYVVGAPQAQHFQMCFAVATMAGWLTDGIEAVHVSFGNVLGTDHRMLASRSGGAVKLVDLLDEAVDRAKKALESRREVDPNHATATDDDQVAQMVGIGAVKYSDLSTDRGRDYVFDWDRMLAFEGNTGPYLQYAHARIRSIFRRGEVAVPAPAPPVLADPHERALGLALLWFPVAIDETLDTYSPHKLCGYLFEVAQAFTAFYENCRVLVDDERQRTSRLILCDLSARVLSLGLSLLGIEAPERM